ncbi:AAA family ATPase [Rhizobium pusense]|uniref:AAA family ATPase n=1 Tax=Agrobacterium pusense TaxID=648995 RepID=UPI001C6DDAB7|nr:AAA family ATPase [Agrobacterium pusense]MBW9076963.1 AAA family ATPase [Agrobacterium pusense]
MSTEGTVMRELRIQNLKISDVGPYTDLKVSFPAKAGISLICGDNGIGKTTLLDAIVTLFINSQSKVNRRQPASVGGVFSSIMLDGGQREHTLAISSFGPDSYQYVTGPFADVSSWLIFIRAQRDIYYHRRDSITRDPGADAGNLQNRTANGFDPNEIKAWFSNRYLLKHHAQNSGWTDEMLENLRSAESFFSLLDPTVTLDRVDIKSFDIIVSTPGGQIPYEYLSSGFKSAYTLLLGILKEIEYRGLGTSASTFAGVILIDELDLHLHPSWQRKIAGALTKAFPSAQIIATTHSPHVIQSAKASEVVALTRDSLGRVRARPVPSTAFGFTGWTIEEVLEDIMGVEDTKTPEFREAMREFDFAIDNEDSEMVKSALNILLEMLHPTNPTRKLIQIQAAPYLSSSSEEGEL